MYWRHRLFGLNFKVFTDHKPLEGLNVNTKFDEELRELVLQISQFNCNVIYLPGARNFTNRTYKTRATSSHGAKNGTRRFGLN